MKLSNQSLKIRKTLCDRELFIVASARLLICADTRGLFRDGHAREHQEPQHSFTKQNNSRGNNKGGLHLTSDNPGEHFQPID